MASDEAYIAAAKRKGLFIAHSRDVYTHVGIKSGGDFAVIEITDDEAEAEQRRIDARTTVTDAMVRAGARRLPHVAQREPMLHEERLARKIIFAALAAQNVEAQ